jgi:hypothetical protein
MRSGCVDRDGDGDCDCDSGLRRMAGRSTGARCRWREHISNEVPSKSEVGGVFTSVKRSFDGAGSGCNKREVNMGEAVVVGAARKTTTAAEMDGYENFILFGGLWLFWFEPWMWCKRGIIC